MVTERPAVIVIDKAWVAVFGVGLALSVTFTVKLEEPAVVGVPEITPPELIVRPAGRLPELVVQLYGVAPPVAAKDWLYATPTCPPGNELVVIASPELTVIDRDWVAVWLALSDTFTTKPEAPAVVGVPEITPPELIDSPAGRLPEFNVQV